MHVLIVASYAPSLLNFRGPLIRDIVAVGHQISVSAPDIGNEIRTPLESLGVRVYETPLQRTGFDAMSDIAYLRSLRDLMRRLKPDVALTYTIKPNIWGAFAAKKAGIPVVAMVTGLGYAFTDDPSGGSLKQKLTAALARRLYRSATNINRAVIFQNPDDREDFARLGCLADPTKVRMVNGSGVDMAHYSRVPLPEEPVFLWIGRLLGNKGVREYAEAALEIRAEQPRARFVIVGRLDEGPDSVSQSELDVWIARGIEFRGYMQDVRSAIAEARVYVLPSYREGTPRSVLEAMAMGRPIITTDAPGCRETVRDGESGLLVPVRDAKALAAAMRRLIEDPERTTAMGEMSYRLCAEKYDVNAVNRTMMRHLGLLADVECRSVKGQALGNGP